MRGRWRSGSRRRRRGLRRWGCGLGCWSRSGLGWWRGGLGRWRGKLELRKLLRLTDGTECLDSEERLFARRFFIEGERGRFFAAVERGHRLFREFLREQLGLDLHLRLDLRLEDEFLLRGGGLRSTDERFPA